MTDTASEVPLARLFAMAFRLLIDDLHDRLAANGWPDVPRSWGFLLLAVRDGALSASELADHLGVTKQAVSQLVDAMQDARLITRTADEHDGRSKRIAITAKGRKLLRTVEAIYQELERGWAAVIGAAQLDAIRTSLITVLTDRAGGTLPPVRPSW